MSKVPAVAATVCFVSAAFIGGTLVNGQSDVTTLDDEARARCYQLAETGTYAEWSVACKGIEPRSQDASVNQPAEDADNPYGEDYSDVPQDESAGRDDGSDAVVAEMRRQEQQRRQDDFFRQEHERQQAYTDQYNAQIPNSYDYGG